jgi:radical SAM superfamily enzyme YgiQ (UPF0313 family)
VYNEREIFRYCFVRPLSTEEDAYVTRPLFRLVIPRVPYPNVFSHVVMPPLGAIYVASAVKQAGVWDVEVIDELNWASRTPAILLKKDPVTDHRRLQNRRPAKVVGFYGGLTSTIPRLLKIARFYQSLGVPTVAGGAHVDALPDELLKDGINIAVHGEGEETILEILRSISEDRPLSDIMGISYVGTDGQVVRTEPRPPLRNLDTRPTPDFSLLAEIKRPLKIVPFERTRGCNYQCEFCIVNDRFGPSRSASPEHVAAEVDLRVRQGFRQFFCVDDNFAQGREGTLKLLSLIKDISSRHRAPLNLTIQVRSSVGRDEELMRAMREAGVEMVAIGLESPIREELLEMEKHQTPEQIEKDIRALKRHGFLIHGMFIFGYPLERSGSSVQLTLRERADRFYAFIKSNALDTIQVLKPVPVPGSRLAERLRSQGRIFPRNLVGWERYDGNFLCFLPDGVSARELQVQATRILRRFYSPLNFLKFPVLVFSTPVEILRLGFQRTRELSRDRAAVEGGRNRGPALRAGFRAAGEEISRRWRNTALRSFGCIVISNWIRDSNHRQFLDILQKIQNLALREPRTLSFVPQDSESVSH